MPAASLRQVGQRIARLSWLPLYRVYDKYRDYTMIPRGLYVRNLALAREHRHVAGAVVECGVWKGGMSAGMAEVIGSARHYYLFDSFEGCPVAQAIDGPNAAAWQANPGGPLYYNNASADIAFSQDAMARAGVSQFTVTKGWFEDTLPSFRPPEGIGILRLDGDWYDSTMVCLEHLFPQLNPGGLVIIDDYYAFDGCALAVHDYLSRHRFARRIHQFDNDVAYLVNRPDW